jgi:hypothetical protein
MAKKQTTKKVKRTGAKTSSTKRVKAKAVAKKSKGTPASKPKSTSYKRGSLKHALNSLFDEKGVDVVKYEEALAAAKKAMPNTKFNKLHFSWYKNKYNEAQENKRRSKVKK